MEQIEVGVDEDDNILEETICKCDEDHFYILEPEDNQFSCGCPEGASVKDVTDPETEETTT